MIKKLILAFMLLTIAPAYAVNNDYEEVEIERVSTPMPTDEEFETNRIFLRIYSNGLTVYVVGQEPIIKKEVENNEN